MLCEERATGLISMFCYKVGEISIYILKFPLIPPFSEPQDAWTKDLVVSFKYFTSQDTNSGGHGF